jgi:hypothetical protein
MITEQARNYLEDLNLFRNSVLEKSRDGKKMNHEQFQAEMLELIKDVYYSCHTVTPPMLNRMARILSAVPAPKGKAMTKWQWAALAVPKQDIRRVLLSIGVKEGYIWGCDSYRIHAYPCNKLADGLYFPKVEGVRIADHNQMPYPNVSVVAKFDDARDIDFRIEDTQVCDAPKVGLMVLIAGTWYRKKYIDDALKAGSVVRARFCEQRKALRIDFEGGEFSVVMGLRE